MTTKILASPEAILGATRRVLSKGPARLAVAFWGIGALKQLGLAGSRDLSEISVICNLSVGGCTPSVIKELLDRGAKVRALATLHAKVYLGPDAAVVGSANASMNALSGRDDRGWNEACVQVTSPSDLVTLNDWFDTLWVDAVDMSDAQVARLLLAQAERDTRGKGGDPVNLLKLLQANANALDGEPLYVTLDWVSYSRRVEVQVERMQKTTGLHVDAWEDWEEMPPAAEILSFHYDRLHRKISYEDAWRTPDDPKSEMDPDTKAILVFAAPRILQNYELGNRNAWLKAVGRFAQDLFASSHPKDKDAILHISAFAKKYLRGRTT